jgi:5-oxoprolinase (ATP-hydrolysing)
MLRIHTVAAGGGSLCRFDGFRLTVGPESAGSDPGPLCYGVLDQTGAPKASELSLTDINLALGRVQPDRFPFPILLEPVERRLGELRQALEGADLPMSEDEIAAGFVEIANASMAEAIAQVSVARGVDPRGHVLVGFGGAGGQHVCGIARRLGMRTILLHPLAGLLSAYGIGVADVTWDAQHDAGRVELVPGGALPGGIESLFVELEARGLEALSEEGVSGERMRRERLLDLRYRGSETALAIAAPPGQPEHADDWLTAFAEEHRRRFGYTRPERAVEIVTVRLRAVAPSESPASLSAGVGTFPGADEGRVLREASVYFSGLGRLSTPVYRREDLAPGSEVKGPALILEDTGTVV